MTIDELEKLEKAATPGPWAEEEGDVMGPGDVNGYANWITSDAEQADAALIAAARNALPELLRIVRHLAEAEDPVPHDTCPLCHNTTEHMDWCALVAARKLAGVGQ